MNPVQFYKALADDTRLKSLLLISHYQELCVCELVTALDLGQPKVSRHLAQLKSLGILSDRRQGQWIFYQLNSELVDWAHSTVVQTLSNNAEYIKADINRLEAMGQRPARIISCCE